MPIAGVPLKAINYTPPIGTTTTDPASSQVARILRFGAMVDIVVRFNDKVQESPTENEGDYYGLLTMGRRISTHIQDI